MGASIDPNFNIKIRVENSQVDGPIELDSVCNALSWLRDHGYNEWLDFEFDMHSCKREYTSFWFRDREKSVEFALACL